MRNPVAVLAPAGHRLTEIAVQSQHLPLGREAAIRYRSLFWQKVALEARRVAVGGQLHGVAVAHRQEH